jgi:hypothetical protein
VEITVPSQRLMLYFLVVVSMLLSAVGTFLTVYNGHNDSERVACAALYNQLNGLARDERATVASRATRADKKQVRAEIDVWKKILKQTTEPQTGTDQEQRDKFVATINSQIDSLNEKLISLRTIQNSRSEFPYPEPDSCKDGKITKEEGNTLLK